MMKLSNINQKSKKTFHGDNHEKDEIIIDMQSCLEILSIE
jgi:hypothetical protein